jgi:hypothetical protein
MREASGKINYAAKGHTGILTIPADIMVDSAFPFPVPSRVRVIIEGDRLIIEKIVE